MTAVTQDKSWRYAMASLERKGRAGLSRNMRPAGWADGVGDDGIVRGGGCVRQDEQERGEEEEEECL